MGKIIKKSFNVSGYTLKDFVMIFYLKDEVSCSIIDGIWYNTNYQI